MLATLSVLSLLPLLRAGTVLPLVDYPNHLARMHILRDWAVAPDLQDFYQIVWRPVPNLAMDAIVPLLGRFLPLAAAGKLFVGVTLLLLAGGTAALHRVLWRRWSLWPCLAFLLLYSRILLWGFVNYLFGLGLALAATATWVGLERRPILRLTIAMVVTPALFFSHIVAFAGYALVIAGIELGQAALLMRTRPVAALGRLAGSAIPFALPGAIFLLTWQPHASGTIVFANFARKLDLPFSVFDTYNRSFDIVCFVAFLALLGVLAWRRILKLDRRMAPALGLVLLAYLALPSQLMTGTSADHRLPLFLLLLLLGSTEARFASRNAAALVAAGMLAMLAARLAVIDRAWQQAERRYEVDLATLAGIAPGAKLAVAFPAGVVHVVEAPELHLPTMAILLRDAFVPTLFADPAQQPVAIRREWRGLASQDNPTRLWEALVERKPARSDAAAEAVIGALTGFDAIIFLDRTAFVVPPNPCLEPGRGGATFQLFAIRRGADPRSCLP